MKRIITAVLFAVLLCGCEKPKEEVLFYNGTVLTMEESRPTAEAVFVRGGVIAHIGTDEEMQSLCTKKTERIDLNGATLLPGFIDGHSHLSQYVQILTIAQLASAESFDDIVSILTAYAKENPDTKEGWIVGFGYDNNNLKEKAHPTKEVLDRVSTERPIIITHASGHMGVFNSKALTLFGVTAQTQPPEGGVIARDAQGNPTGYMEETAFLGYASQVPPSDTDPIELMRKAQQIYLSQGFTTAQDSLLKEKEYELLAEAAEKEALVMDIVGYVDLKNASGLAQALPERLGRYLNRFKIGGYKIFLDGSPQGRTAWLSEPYLTVPGALSGNEADPNYCGYPIDNDETITAFARTAAAQGLPLQAHCNGDAAADQLIRVYKQLRAEGVGDFHRSVMVHSQIVRPQQFADLAELGLIASMFPAHIYYWGDVHLKNLGNERGSHISAAATALKAGVAVTVHQDSPVVAPNMIESLWCMTVRQTKSGVVIAPEERISPAEALKAMTLSAAFQIGEEESKGSIRPGKRADFVVLDKNPLTIAPEEIRTIKVMRTVKDGSTVFSASETE